MAFWLLPVLLDRIPQCAGFGHIGFDEVKVGMIHKRHNALAAEEQRVQDGDPVILPKQFRGQDRADVSCAACDEYMAVRHSSPSSLILYPSKTKAGADLSFTTAMPCSMQVSLQISATSPEPTMRTRSKPAFRTLVKMILHALARTAIDRK
jgi:hypothetical protein